MAFFARVADPAIGGTYMTFLNTISNVGNKVSYHSIIIEPFNKIISNSSFLLIFIY